MLGMENEKIGEQFSETNVLLHPKKQSGRKFSGWWRNSCSEEFCDMY